MNILVPGAGLVAGSRGQPAAPAATRPSVAGRPLVTAVAVLLLLAGCGGDHRPGPDAPRSSATPGVTARTARPDPGATAPSPAPGTSAGAVALPRQPLWPFATAADAQAWQAGNRSGGHQPWHLDPAATALSFTRDFLGFVDVDRTLQRTVTGDDAHVEVGYSTGGVRTGVAAVVHLVRFGSGEDAPWEVVGTDDTTFSLTTPAYGSTVRGPLVVGGRISGVDESIHVQVRPTSGTDIGQVVGESCCQPAGGDNAVWTTGVEVTARPGQGLVVVASTGGHLHEVERFTVTGVRLAS